MAKEILLISHNLNIEGAPLSLFLIGEILKKLDFKVEVLSLIDGVLRDKYLDLEIPVYIIDKDKINFKKYDLIIANTIVTYKYVNKLKYEIPTIWFIRESNNIQDYYNKYPELKNSIKRMPYIYCVSEMAKEFIDKEFSHNVKVLHNFCKDDFDEISKDTNLNDKKSFSVVGTVIPRKGFDIVIKSFLNLEEKYKNKFQLNLLGRFAENDYCKTLQDLTKNNPSIIWHGIKTGEEKKELYSNTDVFIVPSREEPASRVAIEACMYSKPLIVTTRVGAKYLVGKENGWIYKAEDTETLTKILTDILENKCDLKKMGEVSRINYLETSTEEIYSKKLLEIVNYHINNKLTCSYRLKLLDDLEKIQNKLMIFIRKIILLLSVL